MKKFFKKVQLVIHILRMPTETCLQIDIIQEYLYQLYALDELYYKENFDENKRQLFNLKVAEIKWNINEEIQKLKYD